MITPKYILKKKRKNRIRQSIRKKINGTAKKPRMIIVKTNKYLYSQVFNDQNGKVMASVSTLEKEIKSGLKSTKDVNAAKLMGKVIAERLKKIKVKTVVFDRNIYPFTGRIKIFVESAKEHGIKL